MTAPDSPPAVKPHRARTGAVAGSVAAVVVSIVLASIPADEHGEDPSWWGWAALGALCVLVLTGVLLMGSQAWRRFGLGFVAGVLAVLGAEIALFVLFLLSL